MTIQEVSAYLHIKPATLYSKVESGVIPHYNIGHLIRFKREDIDRWMEDHRRDPIDAKKAVRSVLKAKNNGLEQVIKKVIAEEGGLVYSSRNGRPDRIRGLGKEVKDEFN